MTGTVDKYKLASGKVKWFYIFDAAPGVDGVRRQIKKRGFDNKKAAEQAMRERMTADPNGIADSTSSTTGVKVNDLLDQWLKEHVRRYLEPKTAERYADMMDYVRREIGCVPLLELKPIVLQAAFNRLHDSGGKDGKKLSARTVRNIATTLSSALNKAIIWSTEPNFLFNPMKKVTLPKLTLSALI